MTITSTRKSIRPSLSIGDTVRFKSAFLQSACSYTGGLGQLRGTVVGVDERKDYTYAHVVWDYHYFKTRQTAVLASNLERVKL